MLQNVALVAKIGVDTDENESGTATDLAEVGP